MAALNPYLTFLGNCEEAFNYYKSIFGGEFTYIGRFKDMPPQEGMTVSEKDKNLIMHVSLPLSKDTTLMGCDCGEEWLSKMIVGNNITLSISAESKEDADKKFNGLSDGGKVTMPMAKTFWSEYFGMCTDKFGINWMVSMEMSM